MRSVKGQQGPCLGVRRRGVGGEGRGGRKHVHIVSASLRHAPAATTWLPFARGSASSPSPSRAAQGPSGTRSLLSRERRSRSVALREAREATLRNSAKVLRRTGEAARFLRSSLLPGVVLVMGLLMIPSSMANYSHAADHNILQSVSPLTTFLKLTSLGFIIGVGVVGNLLISILLVKDKSLHRAPYYFLLDLCASDILRSAICFPFVFTSVKNGSLWTYGSLTCKVIAFLGVLSCFHTAFMLFCVSVTRYLAIAHHRFYTKRLTFWTCLAVICMVWTLSVAMAFPPVLDVGTYSFIREEDQCTFQHRSFRANDSLGFMLLLALILLATQLVYLKLIFFVHDRRKMKPVQFVPAVSQNWTFHGPGASGQAAANWLAGFGRGPTPPTLLGIRQNANPAGRRRLLVLDEFKTEKRISRMFYAMTFFFLTLWGPYLVACYWRVFARGLAVPGGYLTAAVWMSFAQAGVNPFICIFSNRELRRCFSTTLLYCRKSRLPREPYCVI
ncbi:putative G protein-coupled receptor 85 [Arapaima gigas]